MSKRQQSQTTEEIQVGYKVKTERACSPRLGKLCPLMSGFIVAENIRKLQFQAVVPALQSCEFSLRNRGSKEVFIKLCARQRTPALRLTGQVQDGLLRDTQRAQGKRLMCTPCHNSELFNFLAEET